jgi:hypothetical protein
MLAMLLVWRGPRSYNSKEQKDLPVDCCAFSVVRRLDVSSPPPLTIHFWEFLVLCGAPDFESYLEHWVLVYHRSPSLVLAGKDMSVVVAALCEMAAQLTKVRYALHRRTSSKLAGLTWVLYSR